MTLPVLRSPSSPDRFDLWREFDHMHHTMNRLWDSWFDGPDRTAAMWTPLADLSETDDAWLLDIDAPGLKRDDVTVEVAGSELVVSGQCREKERTGWFRTRTRRAGAFRYTATLSPNVDPDAVTASLTDGVLTVRVPKKETDKPRRIEITAR